MEPNKKIDPPLARNNTRLFNELKKKKKKVVVFQGYKYIRQDLNTLIPQCGIIAKTEDYVPWNPVKRCYSDANMNRFPAYAEAVCFLQEEFETRNPKPKAKKEAGDE